METNKHTQQPGLVRRLCHGTELLIRRTIYPYLKFPYHRLHIWRMKRRISNLGEKGVVIGHFTRTFGFAPNLDNPRTFNEKLAWIKLNVRDPLMKVCADKYAVREYVKDRVGEDYLIPLLGVYDTPEDIPFDDLPAPFVLKVTHASGGNVFCMDRRSFNRSRAIRILRHHLKINAYYYGCEWAYKDVPPRIVCEKVLFEDGNRLPRDFKFLCFNGEPRLIQVDVDRYGDHRENYYDENWTLLPVVTDLPNADADIARPERFDEMKQIAQALSRPFDFARVDLYWISAKIYVGEITFFPGGGSIPFVPEKYELEYGEKIHLTGLSDKKTTA